MPGPFDYDRGVSWMQHKLPYLYGFDLRHALAARLGRADAQVRFLNDAAAFLLGEISAGAAQGVGRAVGITLGTGIGSAFAVDGHVIREGTGVPAGGEIWNFPYQGGILEDQISTRAIRQSYQGRTGEDREVADIAASAAQDAVAAEVFRDFGRTLGTALRTVLGAFGPQVIVLGGGIARSAHLFLDAAQAELGTPQVELRVSSLGEIAPLVGAGAAWFQTGCCISPAADDAGLHAAAEPI
jgi:glucokinase